MIKGVSMRGLFMSDALTGEAQQRGCDRARPDACDEMGVYLSGLEMP